MVSSKQKRTMKRIFEDPISKNILFRDVVSLLESLGAELTEGKGSRLRIFLNGSPHVMHRPHGKDKDGTISPNDIKTLRKLIKGAVPDATIGEYLLRK